MKIHISPIIRTQTHHTPAPRLSTSMLTWSRTTTFDATALDAAPSTADFTAAVRSTRLAGSSTMQPQPVPTDPAAE